MDRRISVLMPEGMWRLLDPNNKSADARALMADGLEYRKIKKQLVERAFQLQTNDAVVGFQTQFLDYYDVKEALPV